MKNILAILAATLSLACVVIVHHSYPNYDYESELTMIQAMVSHGDFADAESKASPILKELKKSRDSFRSKYYGCMKILEQEEKCIKHKKMLEYYEALTIRYENALTKPK